jgi:hypothetical protein
MTDPEMTLAAARRKWQAELNATASDADEQTEYAFCPCCDRKGKIYRVPLGAGPCLSLLWLVNESDPKVDNGFVVTNGRSGAPRAVVDSRSWTVLARYGLAEQETNEFESRARRATWRPTPKGIAFAEGRIALPKYGYAYELEGTMLRYEGDDRYIDQCVSKDDAFDFCGFMRDNYPHVDFDFDAFED